jgi:hypothetical protein
MPDHLPEIKITCRQTDCPAELHCYNRSQRKARRGKIRTAGACNECGANPIEWSRLHRRRTDDIDHTIAAMRTEWIRNHFWTVPFNARSIAHARELGRKGLHVFAEARVRESVGRARHPAEGKQVPIDQGKLRTVIQYGQHAVAACCRACLEKWHGIETGRPLTEDEVSYLSALVRQFVNRRLPSLSEEGATLSTQPVAVHNARRHRRSRGKVSSATD